ncbi:TIR domain-containing protein [Lacibacter luteus]|uniref:TIR domain-containing protein n=1 Tax=Lacibacter luteus TaxID=2508719 RepID=A0A4V1M7I9_9BACT|nr:TIR domain-containing protein [Lacibacter luteus]RXK60032.1 TIR domain-containing protein [Lacibacter luteus]
MLNELLEWLFGTEEKKERRKVFISFAVEDKKYRDFLVSQAKNDRTPFDFIDMSVKEPWDEDEWKRQCRKKIRKCDSMIVLLSKNTWHSSGSRWEIKCAKEERLRIIGMHVRKDDKGAIPPELNGKRIIEWSWKSLEKFLN